MLTTFRTFTRSARNFSEFARAPKHIQYTGLREHEAIEQIRAFNLNRNPGEVRRGVKMEFERENQ